MDPASAPAAVIVVSWEDEGVVAAPASSPSLCVRKGKLSNMVTAAIPWGAHQLAKRPFVEWYKCLIALWEAG